MFKMVISNMAPNIIKKAECALGISNVISWPWANQHSKFLMNVIDAGFKQRKETNKKRNDILDAMIEAVEGNLDHAEDDDIHASNQFEKDSRIIS